MDAPLLRPITKKCADRSTTRVFAFSFFCDQCGKEWRSTPMAFERGNLRSLADIRVLRILRNDQYKAAYEQANLEAIYVFHYCPECGRRVCTECYCHAETDIANICKDCLSKQKK